MIDEELYQQAADELNSDRRRPHIWARACALASDDHDEARFLYTNLRVEELLAERTANGNADSSSELEDDTTLALSPIDATVNEDDIVGFLGEMDLADDEDMPSSVAAPSGIDLPGGASSDLLNLEPLTLDLDPSDLSTSEAVVSTQTAIDDLVEPDADLMADYVPESHDILDDTYAENVLGEEDFEKELETFKAEQGSEEQLPGLSDDDAFIKTVANADSDNEEHDSTTNFSLDSDDVVHIQTPNDVAEARAELSSNGDDDEADLTAVSADDLTQANIGVLDAHTNELDEMLEDARYNPEEPETPDTEMDWLDDEPFSMDSTLDHEPGKAREPTIIEPDPFSDELNRQADELDLGQNGDQTQDHSQQIAEDLSQDKDFPETPQNPVDEPVAAEVPDDHVVPVAAAASAAALVAAAPDLSSPGHAANTERRPDSVISDSVESPLDLTRGRKGKSFSVYQRNNQIQAVKSGVSWSALFLTLPYLIYRHLFGTALAYSVLWVIAIGGLLLSGLAWLDAGTNVTPLIQACTIGFALLSFIGLIVLPFCYANSWRGEKLEARGFELVALAKAKNPGKAIARARRHSAFAG